MALLGVCTERGIDIVQLHSGCNQYGVPAWRHDKLMTARYKVVVYKPKFLFEVKGLSKKKYLRAGD